MKNCSKCKQEKPYIEFSKSSKTKLGLSSWCKTCHNNYWKLNPEKKLNSILKSDYGITLVQYNELLQKQEECCAVCKRHKSNFDKRLSVDHDHKTGKVRGLLCSNCNGVLGRFSDSPDLFLNAAEYLKVSKAMM